MSAQLTATLKHHVYRAYSADGRLLYVGCTARAGQRMRLHAAGSAWWPLMARLDYVTYPTQVAGLTAEAKAIRTEHPVCNVMGRAVPAATARAARDAYLAAHLPAAPLAESA